jgi:hypothetical protein
MVGLRELCLSMVAAISAVGCGLVLGPSVEDDGGSDEHESGGSGMPSAGSSGLELEGCTELAAIELAHWTSDLVVDDTRVYAFELDATSCHGLHVWGVSQPEAPVELAGPLQGVCGEQVVLTAGVLYTHNASAGLLLSVDVSNPGAPTALGTLSIESGRLAALGDYLYLQTSLGLRVIDVSEPKYPTELLSAAVRADDIALAGERAYVTGGDATLAVLALTSPASPTPSVSLGEGGYSARLALSATHAYVADSTGVYIFDLSEPAVPRQVGLFLNSATVHDVALLGSKLYVASTAGLMVLDIANPAAPTLSAMREVSVHHLATVGDRLYVSRPRALASSLHVLACD